MFTDDFNYILANRTILMASAHSTDKSRWWGVITADEDDTEGRYGKPQMYLYSTHLTESAALDSKEKYLKFALSYGFHTAEVCECDPQQLHYIRTCAEIYALFNTHNEIIRFYTSPESLQEALNIDSHNYQLLIDVMHENISKTQENVLPVLRKSNLY